MNDRHWSQLSLILIAATVAVGAYLRFDGLGVPSYWLDEILHQQLTDTAAAKPWWQWFGRLHEEHAALYYLTQLATRIFGRSEFAGRLAAATFGVMTIPVLWFVPLERRARWSAMILLAISPLHVYYSREARGYALILILTAALIVILMRGRSIAASCLLLLALLYSSAVASTVVASAAAVSLLIAALDRNRRRWYATNAACALVVLALFRVIYASRPVRDAGWPKFPAIDLHFLTSLTRMASVTALGAEIGLRAAMATLLFACIGAFAIAKRDRVQGIVLVGMTVLPLAISLSALRVYDHFFSIRYVLPSLIGYLILAGAGIAATAGRMPSRVAVAVTLAATVVLAAQGWHSARTEPFQKLDWRAIAAILRGHVHAGDVILTAEPWSEVSLRFYLGEIPKVGLIHAAGVGIAQILADKAPAAWLVTAGSSGDSSVRNWMCGYPLILASSLEGFRLHYAPSRQRFLMDRSSAPEQRAVSSALGRRGFLLRFGAGDDVVLGEGWAAPDVMRWTIGRRATLVFPRGERHARVIRFRAYPLTHASLGAQTLRLSLNGTRLTELTMAPEWREYVVRTPAARWREGMNEVAFEFGRATAPASFDPRSSDHRELATSFDWLAIEDEGFRAMQKPPEVPLLSEVRVGAEHFLDARSLWRDPASRFPHAKLRRDFVEELLGRLGFDPRTAWPRLAKGEVALDDVVETIAAGSDCEDPEAFLRRAFAILLQRPPNAGEQQDLLRRLHAGSSRVVIVGRIVKSDEFRRAALGSSP